MGQNPLTFTCSITDPLDHLLHDFSPCRPHRPLLHLGRHFIMRGLRTNAYKLIELLPSVFFP